MTSNAQQSEASQVTVNFEREQSQQPPPSTQEEQVDDSATSGCGKYFKRPMKYDPISIVFLIFLFVGGVFAYLTKQSVYSLVASTIFAFFLGAGTYYEGARKNPYPLLLVLAVLASMMGYRFYQSEKFMPSGLVTLLTVIMFARHAYLIYLKRKQSSSALL